MVLGSIVNVLPAKANDDSRVLYEGAEGVF